MEEEVAAVEVAETIAAEANGAVLFVVTPFSARLDARGIVADAHLYSMYR